MQNVSDRVRGAGGRLRYGWIFFRASCEAGEYLRAVHHAVWEDEDRLLVDITPYRPHGFPREWSHLEPLGPPEATLFLVDDTAQPANTKNRTTRTPLANRFLLVVGDEALHSELADLQVKADQRFLLDCDREAS